MVIFPMVEGTRLPRLVLFEVIQLHSLVALPHPSPSLLQVPLAAIFPRSMCFGIFRAIVEIVTGEHDPLADCIFAGVVQLDGLEQLVSLALAPSLCAPVEDVSCLD
jgi:hypothetical protein